MDVDNPDTLMSPPESGGGTGGKTKFARVSNITGANGDTKNDPRRTGGSVASPASDAASSSAPNPKEDGAAVPDLMNTAEPAVVDTMHIVPADPPHTATLASTKDDDGMASLSGGATQQPAENGSSDGTTAGNEVVMDIAVGPSAILPNTDEGNVAHKQVRVWCIPLYGCVHMSV